MDENRDGGRENTPAEVGSNPTEAMSGALLRLSRYLEIINKYHVVKEADLESLADMITRAKGPYRSMRQFAEDVGVSPATMSRIMNQKTAGPLNNETIAKIAANADKQSGVTLEMLLAANGEVKKGTVTSEKLFEEATRQILLDELVKRGYTVASAVAEPDTVTLGPLYMLRFDFGIVTDAVGKGKPGKWLFEVKSTRPSSADLQRQPTGTGRFRQWLTMVMSIYYCGLTDADRISYVVDRRVIFEQVKQLLSELRIPNEISVILIHNGRIAEEFVAPTSAGEPREVFYKMDESREDPNLMDMVEELDWDMDAFSGENQADGSAGRQAGGADGN